MKIKSPILVLMILLALSVSAIAQDDEYEERWRSFEIVMNTGLDFPSGTLSDWSDTLGAGTGFDIGLAGGYYFNDNICGGLYFNYSQFGIDGYDLNYRLYNFGAYGKYCFVGETNLEPYVKITAGSVWPKFATWVGDQNNILRELSYDPVLNGGLYIGALYYTSDWGSVYAELGYLVALTDENTAEYGGKEFLMEDNINYIDIRAGVTVFFGPE